LTAYASFRRRRRLIKSGAQDDRQKSRLRRQSEEYQKSKPGATHDDDVVVAGVSDPTSERKAGPRYWILIVLIAVAVHLVVLFAVKPSYFDVFRKSIDDNIASSAHRPASFPDAIIAITVDVEGEEPTPVEIEPAPERPREDQSDTPDNPNDQVIESDDPLDLLGETASPLPSRPSTRSAVIPPRPVEITWPETKNLGQCLGLHVDVRIQVGEKGEILRVDPITRGIPGECLSAAVRAARRIVFQPGKVNGLPKEMWTEIRIDFRRQTD
jgi:hypothetical protein